MANFPHLETVLLTLAGSTLGTLLLMPQTPWLAPAMRPLTLGMSAAWTLWRLLALERALAHHRAWTQNATWQMDPVDLVHASRVSWWRLW
jgi:hypothetical protein